LAEFGEGVGELGSLRFYEAVHAVHVFLTLLLLLRAIEIVSRGRLRHNRMLVKHWAEIPVNESKRAHALY
jgi:hypothetical protein